MHRASQLLEHHGHVDHAHPGPAVALGHEEAHHPEVNEAAPHLVGVSAVVAVDGAHVLDRGLVDEEPAQRVTELLLLG